MTADEPSIFENLSSYMRVRLMMASAIVFRVSSWNEWTYGHEKLLGVILWNYETKKERKFKYSKLLKKYAYGRTQNYKLLKAILEKNILVKQGNGYYTFSEKYQPLIDKIIDNLKTIDRLGNQKEVK
jgi:hypothetical protein